MVWLCGGEGGLKGAQFQMTTTILFKLDYLINLFIMGTVFRCQNPTSIDHLTSKVDPRTEIFYKIIMAVTQFFQMKRKDLTETLVP